MPHEEYIFATWRIYICHMKNEENLKVAAHYKNKLLNKKNIKIKINKK